MTRIDHLLAKGLTHSFEFFPPKDDQARDQLTKTLEELADLEPSFVSITYGAGGSTRQYTHDLVIDILQKTTFTPMAHLSCVAHLKSELIDIITDYRDHGVENILALSGDIPKDTPPEKMELRFASDLVHLIHEIGDFCVGVAAHPEVHPRSPDRASDRKRLAEKLEIADFAITQFFFEAEAYFRLVDEMENLGVSKPIIPGIMPVTNVAQVQRFAELSGATFPPALAERLYAAPSPEDVRKIGVEVATHLCEELLKGGSPGLHFYTLNRSKATREIWKSLNPR
jgi:methylenetetrahydrofolate reductase (NADPH)